MDKRRAEELFEKFKNDTLNEQELAELESWYMQHASSEQPLRDAGLFLQRIAEMDEGFRFMNNRPKLFWQRFAAAASILLALSAGGYFYIHTSKPAGQQTAQLYKNDIAPGHNQATLTLGNGKKIILTKGLSGILAMQGNTAIQVSNQSLTYNKSNSVDQLIYNTLKTARGEQSPYPLILADGTKVWLNAESSITFPTEFTGKERIVKVTGEALFEVAHNAKQVFKVQTDKQTIEDIGTTFDVNAYANESHTTTTLVEGKIKVGELTLKPGQQTDGSNVINVNVKRYIAWKNGDFDFDGENIQIIMRQLARWYNIDVYYEGKISNDGLTAQISRNRNISDILHILQNTQTAHFKIDGRRVTVIE